MKTKTLGDVDVCDAGELVTNVKICALFIFMMQIILFSLHCSHSNAFFRVYGNRSVVVAAHSLQIYRKQITNDYFSSVSRLRRIPVVWLAANRRTLKKTLLFLLVRSAKVSKCLVWPDEKDATEKKMNEIGTNASAALCTQLTARPMGNDNRSRGASDERAREVLNDVIKMNKHA